MSLRRRSLLGALIGAIVVMGMGLMVLGGLALALPGSGQTLAEGDRLDRAALRRAEAGTPLRVVKTGRTNADIQIFNQDFVLRPGQTVEDNVAVFRGDATIPEGARVEGDLSVFGGDVVIGGEVLGDVAVVGGDLLLRSTARVDGDVSVLGGEAVREPGAVVTGNFVGGFRADDGPAPQVENRVARAQGLSWLTRLLWRLVQAVLWTLLVAGLVILGSWLLPDALDRYVDVARSEPGLSLVLGLVLNLTGGILVGLLVITLCLAPLGLLLAGLLFLLNLVGWAVVVHWTGQAMLRTLATERTTYHPLVGVGLAAFLLTGMVALLWALFPFLGWLVGGIVAALGTGSVVLDLARSRGLLTSGDAGGPQGPGTAGEEPTPSSGLGPSAASQEAPEVSADAPRPTVPAGGTTANELPDAPDAMDDFTRIRGIGPAFARRLQEAGVRTYAQLAAMTPEEVAAVIGWPPARVVRDRILEQAAELAREQGAA